MNEKQDIDSKEERFISSCLNNKQDEVEITLRPQHFKHFPGQEKIKERLQIYVQASKEREDTLGHLLLSGPPGLGKTTLAHIIANTRGCDVRAASAPVIEKPGDLAGLLTSLKEGDVLFIDEIHRLPLAIEEYLYSAMEDFFIDIMLDQGVGARSVRLNVAEFTLIGATTRQGMLSSPLRSRFMMSCRLDYYSKEPLIEIVLRSASILGIDCDTESAAVIAGRCRGTPRIANNLLRWVRDYSQVKADHKITSEIVDKALNLIDIDENGLDEMDKRILETILFKFNGGPVGLKTVAIAVGEEVGTIEDVYEPFLIQDGYLMRTSQGRKITQKTYDLLGKGKDFKSKPIQQMLF
ncbi:MAG: Holliday junction branch migration DNA helicase RuvB [Verrucomicrobiota bacterium]|nr:Holliday junction branch migration DNA helicase RuvB [Verrucomicrobiota bacterium]